MELEHLFPGRQSVKKPPVPHDLVWVLSLNFLPHICSAGSRDLEFQSLLCLLNP
jgi:hypothetical protein